MENTIDIIRDDITLSVTYDYEKPEYKNGFRGSAEIKEVLYDGTNILPFILEFSDDAFEMIEDEIKKDFNESVFETLGNILNPMQ